MLFASWFCWPPGAVWAQVSPLMGLGQVQFFSNSGQPLNSGVLYSFQAGTTTQQATYSDSTGMTANPDPVLLSAAGRAAIWLLSGNYYKFVLCTQNDGAACAPGDTLFTVDNVPGSSAGGGSSGSPFVGIFISGSSMPSTAGAVRLASTDQGPCYRNAANSANICWSKNTNDLLGWGGGSLFFTEVGRPLGVAGSDLLSADSMAHRWGFSNNGGAFDLFTGQNSVDIFTNKTYDTAGTGNVFKVNGTQITAVSTANPTLVTMGGATNLPLTTPTLSSPTEISPLVLNPTFNSGITNSGSGFKHQRFGATCSTGATMYNVCNTTYSWASPFADANYTVVCTPIGQADFPLFAIVNYDQNGITIQLSTLSNAVASYSNVDCVAVHD